MTSPAINYLCGLYSFKLDSTRACLSLGYRSPGFSCTYSPDSFLAYSYSTGGRLECSSAHAVCNLHRDSSAGKLNARGANPGIRGVSEHAPLLPPLYQDLIAHQLPGHTPLLIRTIYILMLNVADIVIAVPHIPL